MLSHVQLFVTPWTVARQAPLSMGILQARILEWVVNSYSRGSSWPRNRTHVSGISCTGRQILYYREAPFPSLHISFQAIRNLALIFPIHLLICSTNISTWCNRSSQSSSPLLCILPLYPPPLTALLPQRLVTLHLERESLAVFLMYHFR